MTLNFKSTLLYLLNALMENNTLKHQLILCDMAITCLLTTFCELKHLTCCGVLYKDDVAWIRSQEVGCSQLCGRQELLPCLSVEQPRVIIEDIE